MTMTWQQNGIRLFFAACLGVLAGLLPGQVNPSSETTRAEERDKVVDAALAQIGVTTLYDPAYAKLKYPGGDVPIDRGVCTDVIIRALRRVDVDLQALVHDDKLKSPAAYPKEWGNLPPDTSIDHRRVPNLMVFFQREGKQVPMTTSPADYLPGDIVAWRLPSGLLHVGLVTSKLVPGTNRPLVVHNIGEGAQCEDVLFAFTQVGHYRWFN